MTQSKRIYLSGIYFVVIIATLLLRVGFGLRIYEYFAPLSSDYLFTIVVQLGCFFLLPLSLYALFFRKHSKNKPFWREFRTDFGFNCHVSRANRLRTIGIAFLMIFAAIFFSSIWQSMLRALGFTRTASTVTNYSNVGVLLSEIAMTALLPALFEEFTHRGLLFGAFSRRRSDKGWHIIPISALLFALMHQNVTQVGYTFFDGLILAALAYYSRSIYPSIAVHFINNFHSVMTECGVQNGGLYRYVNMFYSAMLSATWTKIVYFILSLVAVALIVLMLYGMRQSTKRAYRVNVCGVSFAVDEYTDKTPECLGKKPYSPKGADNVWLYLTVLTGITATVFTLVWGILR